MDTAGIGVVQQVEATTLRAEIPLRDLLAEVDVIQKKCLDLKDQLSADLT